MREEDPINYVQFFLDAYRSIVHRTLTVVAEEGMPAGHDIYLTFRTHAPGVEVPEDLAAQYPQVMTIVLQHEFWDLEVEEDGLSVTLMFSRVPKDLIIPFSALVFFEDRQAGVRLGFLSPEELADPDLIDEPEAAVDDDETADEEPERLAEVVSLDAFKRR